LIKNYIRINILKLLKFASIDVGSNAVRLLFTNVFETPNGPVFRKLSLVRVPIRLGEDAFVHGRILEEKADQLVRTMRSFKHLMNVHQVLDYKAYATSAMREAENSLEILKSIKVFADINLEIVSGDIEAETISTEKIPSPLPQFPNAVFIDVGGGSTEMTFLRNHKKYDSISLKIGTIRLLHNTVSDELWSSFYAWFDKHNLQDSRTPIIGTGGNINKLLKVLREGQNDYFIATKALKRFKAELESVDVDERMVKFILNPDRADVIIPASNIFLKAASYMASKEIYIPKVGLSDGIARQLYQKHKTI
jgi:exopolyphosphatase/guanosine-5'-triphosphate,3'-diphosphate pyrophosphatase